MIHKFISNDNKGNVNTLEIGSDYTKISKVVDPVNDDDVANKKYVDQAGGSLPSVTSADNGKVLNVENGAWDIRYVRDTYQQQTITIVVGEDYSLSVDPSSQTSLNYYEQNRITCINLVDSNGSTLASLVAQPAMLKLVGAGFAFDYVTPIVPLDALGLTGYVGFFYTYEYSEGTYAYLYKWQATQGIA